MRLAAGLLLALVMADGAEFDHSRWDRLLKRFVNDKGEVDYGAIRKDHREMDLYIAELGAASPLSKPSLFPNRDHEMAYWINAYNAFVTWGIASRYPVASVRDIGPSQSFFKQKQFVAGAVTVSPDVVEHDILRKQFKDPRVHMAIVCASIGCPYLSTDAYVGAQLQAQLDRAARTFVNQPRNFTIEAKSNTVTLSKIFEWYGEDFGGPAGLTQFLLRYSNEAGRSGLMNLTDPKFRYRDYDWHVNDPGSRK